MLPPAKRVIFDRELFASLKQWTIIHSRSEFTGIHYIITVSPNNERTVYGVRGPMFYGEEAFYVGDKIE